MGRTRKWLVLSPFTGEILSISDEEARRLIRPSAGNLIAELKAATSRAGREGIDIPVGAPEEPGEWLVCSRTATGF